MLALSLLSTVTAACAIDESTSSATSALAGSDRLDTNESLWPGEGISSGSTTLVYQGDNNLVLYQGGNAIWATMAALGEPPNRFTMQDDCNAVVYSEYSYSWASWTNGAGGGCTAHVIEGDWFICSGGNRVFSARGGGNCDGGGGGGWQPGDPLAQMPRIGGNGDAVGAYYIHMLMNTEITVFGVTRSYWDMIDKSQFLVTLGDNGGAGTRSFRVFFHYTAEGHWMIAYAQDYGSIRYRNTDTGAYTDWFGFTNGGLFDPTLHHANMDHAYKSLFEESGKDLCIQPQWNEGSTVGEVDIDFHRQWEVADHGRADNSDPLTTCSGGCKNNNWYFRNAWGTPGGLPGFSGEMSWRQTSRGPVLDLGAQRDMPGFRDLAIVLAGRDISVITGTAVPR